MSLVDGSLVNGASASRQVDEASEWIASSVGTIPPNSHLLLGSLNLTPARLQTSSKVAISVSALRALLTLLAESLPFDEDFYKTTYPDLAEAFQNGAIPDLHQHFVQNGFFEGRLGALPDVDEKYYRGMYPDIDAAMLERKVTSALGHYVGAGAAEGRFPNAREEKAWKIWLARVNDNSKPTTT